MRRPLILAIAAGAALGQDANWDAGTGVWSAPQNWLNSNIADNASENAIFGDRGGYTVTMDGSYEVASLQFLDAGAFLHIPSGRVLGINGPFCNLFGPMVMNSDNWVNNSILAFRTDCTLQSNGGILMTRGADDCQILGDPGVTLTTQTGTSIRGGGIINCRLDHSGDIHADLPGQTLSLQGQDIDNKRVINAENTAILNIAGITIDQSQAGWLTADDATIVLTNATVRNKGITTTNGGVVNVSGTDNWLHHLQFDGRMNIPSGFQVNYTGPEFFNLGEIVLNSDFWVNNAIFRIHDELVLEGDGSIDLFGTDDSQVIVEPGATLHHRTNHTIHGSGYIIGDLDNLGLVSADDAGATLRVSGGTSMNSGTMEARDGGTLKFLANTLTQASNGWVLAHLGGTVDVDASVIEQGTIEADGGSLVSRGTTTVRGANLLMMPGDTFSVIGGSTTLETMATQSLLGQIRVYSGTALHLDTADVPNDGTILLNFDQWVNNAILHVDRDCVLSGTGDVHLSRPEDDAQIVTNDATLTNGPAHTIHGRGYLDAQLVNLGLVEADYAGERLRLFAKPVSNEATMRASDGARLRLEATPVTQGVNGVVESTNGGVVELSSATISGGRLHSDGASTVTSIGSTTLADVHNTSVVNQFSGTSLHLMGPAWRNDGVINANIDLWVNNALIHVHPGAELRGDGEIRMLRASDDCQIIPVDGTTVVNHATHTVRGGGYIHGPYRNEGLTRNDIAGDLTFFNALENNAIIDGTGAGRLVFSGTDIVQGPAGLIEITDNQANFNSTTLEGGTFRTHGTGSGLFQAVNTLGDVTLDARILVPSGSVLNFLGPVVNDGIIELNSDFWVNNSIVNVHPGAMLEGSGELRMQRGSDDCQIIAAGGATEVTNDVGHTVRGLGYLVSPFINDGILKPGFPTGSLAALSGYSQTATGVFGAHLAAGGSGVLNVTGDAHLAGTLTAELEDGFIPQVGDEWVVMTTTGSVIGEFDDYDLPDLGILSIRPIITASDVRLTTRCTVDLAEPYETLDIFDVLEFLNLFQLEDPFADLAEPAGVYDIFDIIEFLGYFEQGC